MAKRMRDVHGQRQEMAENSSTSRPMRRVRLAPTLAMKRGARKQARMLSAALAVNQWLKPVHVQTQGHHQLHRRRG